MKKDILKKIAIAISFMTITGIYTTTYTAKQMNSTQKQFMSTLIVKLENFVKFTTNWTDEFFNKANKESYNVHVDRMKKHIEEFEREILKPVKKQRVTKDNYGKIISITKDVILHLYKQTKDVYKVLDENRGKGALRLGLSFRSVKKYSTRTVVNDLKNKLKEVQRLLNQLDASLSKKVTAIIAQVEKQIQKNEKRRDWDALSALKHRFACTGGPATPSKTLAKTVASYATTREARQAAIAAKRAARKKSIY